MKRFIYGLRISKPCRVYYDKLVAVFIAKIFLLDFEVAIVLKQ